jgi:hypothetical protein
VPSLPFDISKAVRGTVPINTLLHEEPVHCQTALPPYVGSRAINGKSVLLSTAIEITEYYPLVPVIEAIFNGILKVFGAERILS